VIAATHQDLYSRVQKGYFREDLYYRLKVFPINLPPLRGRKEDLPLLISHFIKAQNLKTGKQIQGVSQAALRILLDYPWPGNVREIENAIEHAFVLCNKERIDPFDLPVEIRQSEYPASFSGIPEKLHSNPVPQKKLSKEVLLKLLDECDWNKAEVGRRAGVSRTAIWKYMKKWEISLKKPSKGKP